MKSPRVRFRVRRLMVAVAVVALSLGVVRLGQRVLFLQRRAGLHAGCVEGYRAHLQGFDRQIAAERLSMSRAGAEEAERLAVELRSVTRERELFASCLEWHADLAEQLRHAAWRPWSGIPPEPPDPRGL